MKGYFVYKEHIKELYGDKLQLKQDLNSSSAASTIDINKEKYPVSVINRTGKIVTVQTLDRTGYVTKFVVLDHMLTQEDVPTGIEVFTPVLEKYHAGHYKIDEYTIFIHYPELVIKNSLNMSHTIYDLIVQIPIDNVGCRILNDIYGVRTSFTKEEVRIGYLHSHLHRNSYKFSSFCRGGGSSFDKFISSLNRIVDAFEFELFLIQLKEFLCWESLEGTPYLSINELKTSGSQTLVHATSITYGDTDLIHTPITDLVISKLVTGECLATCLLKVGNEYIFDPNLAPDNWLEFEKSLHTILPNHVCTWNPATTSYVASTSSTSGYRLPGVSISNDLLKHFNLTIKEITSETISQPMTTIKRLSTNVLERIVQEVNYTLQLATYKHG